MKSILKKFFTLGFFISVSCVLKGQDKPCFNTKGEQTELPRLIAPYLGKSKITFETLETEFSGKRGPDKFLSRFCGANLRSYDPEKYLSYIIRADVLVGIIGLAWKYKDESGMKSAIEDCIGSILYEDDKDSGMINVQNKLGEEQKRFLEEILEEASETASTSTEHGSSNEEDPF
jgi:hypothetical protein